ncbi:hypothetical protein bpr_II419 (plasmid) [Butyrivibrio proteoclasticus B316]|uniref:Uncharacterized protein n=1 Tax=Butyrivibrio proteoclasticus (strain ATCC 51982 / DSM 14932 / B316) TaxID=515622 RepID=E0S4M4_BUTPB|nr:hypothetical protein [Butyrivibrio proteoclasticus]ADL36356.1 hypothetical protein bpr_II419 [Butyrivibrio proteoclasticus B316]
MLIEDGNKDEFKYKTKVGDQVVTQRNERGFVTYQSAGLVHVFGPHINAMYRDETLELTGHNIEDVQGIIFKPSPMDVQKMEAKN